MQVCSSPDDEETLLICDWCQQGVHMACHTPAVADLPDDEDAPWFCSNCADTVRRRDGAVSVLRDHRAACAAAGIAPEAVAAAKVSPDDEISALEALLSGSPPDVEMVAATPARAAATDDDDDDDIVIVNDAQGAPACSAAAAAKVEEPAAATANAAEPADGAAADVAMKVRPSPLPGAGIGALLEMCSLRCPGLLCTLRLPPSLRCARCDSL